MKKILGLDLGTNSIGWAVVNADIENGETKIKSIESAGSRIIPMDEGTIGVFEQGGNIKSKTAERTRLRGIRRLIERLKLRRERLNRVLNLMGFLPEHYSAKLDRYGKFIDESEPKLPWSKDENGKSKFLFQESFNEMCVEFKRENSDIKNIPSDWTIYYLRKKALTQPISKFELAWILLNFNQKRGYYQFREEEGDKSKNSFYCESKVLKVVPLEDEKDKYLVSLDNGIIGLMESKTQLNWENRIREFIVTKDVNKDGEEKIKLRVPKDTDKDLIWESIKSETEKILTCEENRKFVGEYIYDELLKNPQQKIIGKLVQVIDREFYKQELIQILEKQKESIVELNNIQLFNECIESLYPNNKAHRDILNQKDFTHLFVEDILFYQRSLKTKKHLISNCPYETRKYEVKCVTKSHPLFQEFRLWQFISNLKIYKKGVIDQDCTNQFLKTEEDIVALFNFLNNKKEIGQDSLLTTHFKIKKEDKEKYRWNYVEDKKYPCNTTHASLLSRLKKLGVSANFLTKEIEEHLWHILYSISDKKEIYKALLKFAKKYGIEDSISFAEELQKEIFQKEYASYSLKAIKKLLPLMRCGDYWKEDDIDTKTKDRIEKIITGELDEKIDNKIREKLENYTNVSQFKGLPLWLACYVVYGRHSEAKEITKWEKPEDIDDFLIKFKQHSLRNPIVEQIVTETLRTVRDIWKQVGSIDEIHLELGRNLKNDKETRKRINQQNINNEKTNLRIRKILQDLNYEYSISKHERFKIYEDFALSNLKKDDEEYEFIEKIKKESNPTKSEIERYKLWLEQKYKSPYTGQVIPLSELFSDKYQIEHIIPQARYFDDSFNNKVICEANVNNLKDKKLGCEFISEHGGEIVQLSNGKSVTLFTLEQYVEFVQKNYATKEQKNKRNNLLRTEIPEDFIHRQLNDTRYISKYVKSLLSNIVREKRSDGTYEEEVTSKNIIVCSGGTTTRLKQDWGMNDVWNKIILPRFQRLNQLTEKNEFVTIKNNKEEPIVPDDLVKGFNKKRIDHRHHAMDAIVIACTTRSHVNLLNNEAALSENKANRYQLQYKLREREKVIINGEEREVFKAFYKPWDTFTQDAEQVLRNIVVSFKQNLRVITKATNKTQYIDKETGKIRLKSQEKGELLAIRKQLHAETIFGETNLRQVKEIKLADALKKPNSIVDKEVKNEIIRLKSLGNDDEAIIKYFNDNKDIWSETENGKVKVYYFTKETNDRYFATRKSISDIVKKKEDIASITDTGIQKILQKHLEANEGDIEKAFSREGFEEMNQNIYKLNDNKPHKPIYKARKFEKSDKNFAVGNSGDKSKKFVKTAQGTNLFFAIYELNDKRSYVTIPLNLIIDCQKKYKGNWKEQLDSVLKEEKYVKNNKAKLLFIISPNDLVYIPTQEELKTKQYSFDRSRIYKLVSCDSTTAMFIPATFANVIFSMSTVDQKKNNVNYIIQNEIGKSMNKSKSEKSIIYGQEEQEEVIKETCIPIKVDRLGNIISCLYD